MGIAGRSIWKITSLLAWLTVGVIAILAKTYEVLTVVLPTFCRGKGLNSGLGGTKA